ncbi:MAG: alpha-amylase family protein [Prevotella sp.]|nr:alpha-amylase family protein [Prevotella sp.]
MANKIVIYQILPRLYKNANSTRKENGSLADNGCGKLKDLQFEDFREMWRKGATHVWLTGVIRHATKTDYSKYGIPVNHPAIVKGNAGSPYAITDYYDVDPDLAVEVDRRMIEFEATVRRAHNARMGVIIDFVPNHVARQYHSISSPAGVHDLGKDDKVNNGFDPQNNFYYCPGCEFRPNLDLYAGQTEPYVENPAKATGNDHFDPHPGCNDWYETVKLNYGVDYYAGGVGHFEPIPDTWKKMLDILLFWASKGVDGVRCDMAEMVPVAFWRWVIPEVKKRYPDYLFIGEVYNPALYREFISAGYDYLYDKVGMYDTLRDVICGRKPASSITGAWQATDDICDHMLYFLENHDEQRIASQYFAGDARKAIPALAVSALFNKSPFMLYFGQEYGEKGMDKEGFSGQDGRTTIFDYWGVETMLRKWNDALTDDELILSEEYSKILDFARTHRIIEGKTYDLMYCNPHSSGFNPDKQFAFLRSLPRLLMLVVANFDSHASNIAVNIPGHAFEWLKLSEGQYDSENVLTGEKNIPYTLSIDKPVELSVPADGVTILLFKKRK